MPTNNDQSQFLMFTGIGAVGMAGILALIYFVGFSGNDSSAPAPSSAVADSSDTNTTTPLPGTAAPGPNGSGMGSYNADQARMQQYQQQQQGQTQSSKKTNPASNFLNNQKGNIEKSGNPLLNALTGGKVVEYRNNLKMIMLAAHNYHDVHRSFPVAKSGSNKSSQLSWRVHLLPFMEQEGLYDQFHLDEPWDSPHNKSLLNQMPREFKTPGVSNGQTGIVRFAGAKAWPNDRALAMRNIIDGTSNTVFCTVVKGSAAVPWTKPDDLAFNEANPAENLLSVNGAYLFAFCDGTARSVKASIDKETLLRLIMPADGKQVGPF